MYLNEQKSVLFENGQAGALSEIEITPAMIESGTRFLWRSGRLRVEADGPDQLLVAQLLKRCLGSRGYIASTE